MKDVPNIMGDTYPLVRSVFADVSGVKFVDASGALPAGSVNQSVKLFDAVSRTPRDTLRAAARDILRWRPDVEAQIQGVLKAMGIPEKFDIGVHMRTGTKSVDRYIRAVETFAATAPPGRKVRVFVASDNAAMLKEFESRMTDSPHEVYNIAGAAAEGFSATAWGAKSFDDKFNDAMVFFTELYLLQRCPMLVCALSSNVGKFLLLTAASARNFKSVDLPELVPL